MKCENLSLLFIFIYEFIGKTAQPLFSTFFAECNFTELHRVFRYFDPFQLAKEALAHQPKGMAEAARNTRGIGLHMVKSHAVNFFLSQLLWIQYIDTVYLKRISAGC